jgi:glycosyltransferase involved in cell wall biosynthesis
MKLVINIPCYNEEQTLPLVLQELPKKIAGIDTIEVQIIDDGSTDNTAGIAEKAGCRVIRHKRNLGLGVAFKHGVEAALAAGADIMVNTDADNQYPSKYISDLVKPVVNGAADLVIGDRQTWQVAHFSPLKKILQWFGSSLVRRLTGTDVVDTVSGFRAYSRESLLRLNVLTKFSYVLDTVMQCAKKDLKIMSVSIEVNPPTRKSRLFKNMFQHMRKSGTNLLRLYIVYMPFATFCVFSALFAVPALGLILRFLYEFFADGGHAGHIQSLIAATILAVMAALMFVLGIVGELLKTNRELTEEQLYYVKKNTYQRE